MNTKIKTVAIFSVTLSMFLVGATVYGASEADSVAQKYGYPTVTSLLAVEAMQFTPQWEQNVKGYNSNDGTYTTYNSTYFATPSTADKLASWFGGTVIPQSSYNTGGPFTIPTGAAIKIGDTYLNAGSVAEKLRRLQITYTEAVKNYERNLLENESIASSGNLSIPTDPLVSLKSAFGVSGGSSGNTSNGSGSGSTTEGGSTNRTIGDCVGRGCPSGSGSVGTSYQVNSATANYVKSLVVLVNNLIVEAKAKLELSNTGVSNFGQYNPNNIIDAPSKNTTATITTGTSPVQNTTTTQKCTGDIYRNLEVAKTCAALAQSQGTALGYNISCSASKITLPGNTPGADYYISSTCTVNGSAGHGAYMLAGFDPGTSGYVGVNSGWKILKTELDN